jgi:hypothetical protein
LPLGRVKVWQLRCLGLERSSDLGPCYTRPLELCSAAVPQLPAGRRVNTPYETTISVTLKTKNISVEKKYSLLSILKVDKQTGLSQPALRLG